MRAQKSWWVQWTIRNWTKEAICGVWARDTAGNEGPRVPGMQEVWELRRKARDSESRLVLIFVCHEAIVVAEEEVNKSVAQIWEKCWAARKDGRWGAERQGNKISTKLTLPRACGLAEISWWCWWSVDGGEWEQSLEGKKKKLVEKHKEFEIRKPVAASRKELQSEAVLWENEKA